MKLITTTVSLDGFGSESKNQSRIDNAKVAIEKAKEMNADILSLPAGYLFAQEKEKIDDIANAIIEYAQQEDITVIFGVDQKFKKPSNGWINEVKSGTLPCFCYVWNNNDKKLYKWRQRSINSRDQQYTLESSCHELRLIKYKDSNISILMCGEIFNRRIRDNLIKNKDAIKIVIDLAHKGKGLRVFKPMMILSRDGISSVVSVHVNKVNAMKYHYSSKCEKLSARDFDAEIVNSPRIEMKLWDVD